MAETLLAVVIAVLAAIVTSLVLRRRVGFLTKIDSISMAPGLVPGQRLLTRRLPEERQVQRGDIVVVRSEELGRMIVKRVVGLPGERVQIDDHGGVRIDGVPLVEPYVMHRGGPAGTFTVPEGNLLLLGDNRGESCDSRSWRQPFLPIGRVQSRVVKWPPIFGQADK